MRFIILLVMMAVMGAQVMAQEDESVCRSQIVVSVEGAESGFYLLDGDSYEQTPILEDRQSVVVEVLSLAWSPDGKRLLTSVQTGDEELYELVIYDVEDESVTPVSSYATGNGQWSTAGDMVAYFAVEEFDEGVYVDTLDGEPERFLTYGNAPFAWRDNDTLYHLETSTGELYTTRVSPEISNIAETRELYKPEGIDKPIEAFTLSPYGRYMTLNAHKFSELYLVDIENDSVELLEVTAPAYTIRWSPDSSAFGYSTMDTVYLHEIGGETEALEVDAPEGSRLSLAGWSPDGTRVLIRSMDFSGDTPDIRLWVVTVDTGEAEAIYTTESMVAAAWSPCIVTEEE